MLDLTTAVVLGAVTAACLGAAAVWWRAAIQQRRAWLRIANDTSAAQRGIDAADLARSAFRKELHTAVLYGAIAVLTATAAAMRTGPWSMASAVLVIPVAVTLRYGPRFLDEARIAEQRVQLERRAEEVLAQQQLAPQRWAARLAPAELPVVEGFELGMVYEAGSGVMAGDFYDVCSTGPHRLAAVIGDVSGHGIEPSITAFQVKYLLRVFMRQYRDPAQALEELNALMSVQGREEEFVSLVAVIFDTMAGTLRYASAGHPAAWLWSSGQARALRATGPLLTLDPKGTYASKELELGSGDMLLLYTDGLAEARSGEQVFGEDRVAGVLRRDPGLHPRVLCKNLLETAQDFASGPIPDDIAILAIRRA